jgi:hypothetical protein
MHSASSSLLFAATLFALAGSAVAGVGDAITTNVEPLASTVSYSKTGTIYKVGYKVTISRVGNNNVNSVVFRGTTAVLRRPDGPSYGTAEFLESDDIQCQPDTGGTEQIACTLGRFRAGDAPRTFAVFFKAPLNVRNVNAAANPTIELVRFTGTIGYSEDRKDGSGVVNDTADFTAGEVSLGTPDPTNVQGAVSKQSGALLSTGPNDAVPSTATFEFATKVSVPPTPLFTSATVQLKRFSLIENPTETQLCAAEKNFYRCYESALTIPGLMFPVVTNPANQKYVTTLLRIDASEVQPGFSTRKVKVFYTDDNGFTDPNGLPRCADLPLSNTTSHCVVNIKRYGNSAGDLANDVEVETRGLGNGRTTIY